MVFGGIGLAFLGQLVAIGVGVIAVVIGVRGSDSDGYTLGFVIEVVLQVVLFVASLVVGIVWIVRKDRGLGVGILIGWAVGTLILPVVGIGVCLAVLNNQSTV
jgi:hypothetical protein